MEHAERCPAPHSSQLQGLDRLLALNTLPGLSLLACWGLGCLRTSTRLNNVCVTTSGSTRRQLDTLGLRRALTAVPLALSARIGICSVLLLLLLLLSV